jgi:hypothetical protein
MKELVIPIWCPTAAAVRVPINVDMQARPAFAANAARSVDACAAVFMKVTSELTVGNPMVESCFAKSWDSTSATTGPPVFSEVPKGSGLMLCATAPDF